MFIPSSYEGNGVITDSRRIKVFFERGELAQRYLLKMRFMDKSSREEYKRHLISSRIIKERIGYGRGGVQYVEFINETGFIPQIEEKFRRILIAETEGCKERKEEALSKLNEQFKTYLGLIEFGKVDAIPSGIFEYKVK